MHPKSKYYAMTNEPIVMSIESGAAVALITEYKESGKKVFKEDATMTNKLVGKYKYMPWGTDDRIPYDILELIEEDEVITACQQHNIKSVYGAGIVYKTDKAAASIREEVEDFFLHNDLTSYFYGVATDIKYWGWAVSVLTLSNDATKITGITRREAMYCRVAPADEHGLSPYILYGDFRNYGRVNEKNVERISLLSIDDPLGDLETRLALTPAAKALNKKATSERKFAVVTRIPTVDATHYPIPYYAAIFKGKWFDIKQLIALAKYAKLKNAAPLKYIVEIRSGFFDDYCRKAGITDIKTRQEEVNKYKKQITDYLTGAENAGKSIFTEYYIDPASGKPVEDIIIKNVEAVAKEGGDWQTDIQEAINMICFSMGVHSNLVGSVPGKSQSNNSGSDKRELYMIAQSLEKPTRDLLMAPQRILCHYNKWKDVVPECQTIQLTTLDEHKDIDTKSENNTNKEE